MSIRIGLARLDDAAPIARTSRALVEHGLPWSWTVERVVHCIKKSECAVIVARDRRRLAGFAIMEFYDQHAHLGLLAVRPGYQQRGIGSNLVRWLEASARVAGIFDVRLELRASNHAARRFYERLGYSLVGVRKCYYAGVEDASSMTHDLRVLPASSA
jgi:ribosomal-protein-alanine N-acetyltransferase